MASRNEKVFFGFLFGGIGLCFLFAISPVLLLLLAGFATSHLGCVVNEGNAHPCLVLGIDIGEMLYLGALGGFLPFITIPAGIVLAGIYTVLMLVSDRIFRFTKPKAKAPV